MTIHRVVAKISTTLCNAVCYVYSKEVNLSERPSPQHFENPSKTTGQHRWLSGRELDLALGDEIDQLSVSHQNEAERQRILALDAARQRTKTLMDLEAERPGNRRGSYANIDHVRFHGST